MRTKTPKNALAFDKIKKNTLVTLHRDRKKHLLWINRIRNKKYQEFDVIFIGSEYDGSGCVMYNAERRFTRPTKREIRAAIKKLTKLKEKMLKPIDAQLQKLTEAIWLGSKKQVTKKHTK